MTHNASDRKSIRAAEKRAKLDDENDRTIIANLMSTYGGRAYLWRRLEAANVFSTVYNESPSRMAFNEGIRCSGLDLLNAVIAAAPDQFITAMREANSRKTEADTLAQPADSADESTESETE